MNILNNSYIETDTRILRQNALAIMAGLPRGAQLIPVLKGDAYGLGLCGVAKALADLPGIGMFAVAHAAEGIALRDTGVKQDILVMGNPIPFQVEAAVAAGLTLTLGRTGLAETVAAAARRLGVRAKVQVKVETGLHRIGLAPGDELDALVAEVKACGNVMEVTGAFSHFADPSDPIHMEEQYQNFLAGITQLEQAGIPVSLRHIADSAASEYAPQYAMDAVRVGRRLYMDHPTRPLGTVREVASWRAYVTGVYPRKAGDTLGYDMSCRLRADTTVATVGIGYGDGLDVRYAEKNAPVLAGGERRPVLACCMDQSFVDVTGLDVRPGDEITVFGYDGKGNFLSAQEAALTVGANEGCGMTGALSPRVDRKYV